MLSKKLAVEENHDHTNYKVLKRRFLTVSHNLCHHHTNPGDEVDRAKKHSLGGG